MVSFFFNDTATTEIYTLSLHDALPIFLRGVERAQPALAGDLEHDVRALADLVERDLLARRLVDELLRVAVQELHVRVRRSEEHTSELQSRQYLVCRLLLEKKKTQLKFI